METSVEDQQFCLRWNNFQANITSQFEKLRDSEDFVDVTIACEGRRLGAHKVVLSACSPFFKELFKSNPCQHPIIFMQDVQVKHMSLLLEFMYAGQVNVAQAQLSGFLRTAEALQIRGLTDRFPPEGINNDNKSNKIVEKSPNKTNNSSFNEKQSKDYYSDNDDSIDESITNSKKNSTSANNQDLTHSVTSNSVSNNEAFNHDSESINLTAAINNQSIPPYANRDNNFDNNNYHSIDEQNELFVPNKRMRSDFIINNNNFLKDHGKMQSSFSNDLIKKDIFEPKEELPDYQSDEEDIEEEGDVEGDLEVDPGGGCDIGFDSQEFKNFYQNSQGYDSNNGANLKDILQESNSGIDTSTKSSRVIAEIIANKRKRLMDNDQIWSPIDMTSQTIQNNNKLPNANSTTNQMTDVMLTRLAQVSSEWNSNFVSGNQQNQSSRNQGGLIKLGEGVEICEEQLRSVKWSDYRKLTRGLATILFSPMELATCSVTGQRWSRAGTAERPVKPALDRAKVQAIISYVATRFPMVEVSRIKQVLAYKCKENSTAFKMKAIRLLGDNNFRSPDNQ